MEFIRSIETSLAKIHKDVPHLPRGGKKWLATNIWWIVLVLAILGGVMLVGVLLLLLLANSFLLALGGPLGAFIGGAISLVILISLTVTVVNTVLALMAIAPLQKRVNKGWQLLFVILLINALSALLMFIFTIDLGTLAINAFWFIVGAYFLFEIRDEFTKGQAKSA